MNYTIKQASKITKLPSSTLRYYESEGLIPEIKRNENGHRYYDESNLKWITLITCLKNTNMPIQLIKIFVALYNEGDKLFSILLSDDFYIRKSGCNFKKHINKCCSQ